MEGTILKKGMNSDNYQVIVQISYTNENEKKKNVSLFASFVSHLFIK